MRIQSNLRLLMAEYRINSVTELVDKSGLSRGAIDKVYHEKNLEKISLGTLVSLCEVFDCKLDDLIRIIKK